MKDAMGRILLCGTVAFFSAACSEALPPDRSGSAPTRAVQDPSMHNDAFGEEMAGTEEGVPLVTVDFPNKDGQAPRVRTFVDYVHDSLTPPTTAPANTSTPGETTTRPAPVRVDPLTGQ